MTEKEIIELYGKSIWNMTAQELYENGLVHIWVELADAEADREGQHDRA